MVYVFCISGVRFHTVITFKKIKLSLNVTKLQIFISLVPDGAELSSSPPGWFTPGERATITWWIGGWGPRPSLDALERSILPLLRIKPWFLGHSACNLVCLFQNSVQSAMLMVNQWRPLLNVDYYSFSIEIYIQGMWRHFRSDFARYETWTLSQYCVSFIPTEHIASSL